MTNSKLFKLAHKLTKATIKNGESYMVNFSSILKSIHAASKKGFKLLTGLEMGTIQNAMLRNNKTDSQIKEAFAIKTLKMNIVKKVSFWGSFDECDESGMM